MQLREFLYYIYFSLFSGLLGYIRLQVNEHTIIESHPDNEFQDLRLDCPFPELVDFMNLEENDLVLMPKNKYMHVPYVVILYKYLEDWKKTHDGNFPQNWKEKREIRDIIKNSKYWSLGHLMTSTWTLFRPPTVPNNSYRF